MAKLINIKDSFRKKEKKEKRKTAKQETETKVLKSEIKKLKKQIDTLTLSLDTINNKYLESAQTSVELLSDLDYNRYKASFVENDIKHSNSYTKLRKYRQTIVKFFLNELRCCYIRFSYSGFSKKIIDILNWKSQKKHKNMPGFLKDRSKLYYIEIVDKMFPKRKIGKIIIGREPYRDKRKERSYEKKVQNELLFIKRVLENAISEIHNRELAIKDVLTGLYNRKFLDEKLTDEFYSLDVFSKLDPTEKDVLLTVMKLDGNPYKVLKNHFFLNKSSKDEEALVMALDRLRNKNYIYSRKDKFLGELEDFYYFENSKMSNNLFIAMFDLDHFKDVNDNWGGHSVGDQVLIQFTKILKKYIRTTDIAVRHGGEEFLIIFPRANSIMKIREVLENIRVECEKNLIVDFKGKTRNVTVSIGMTQISKYDINIQQMLNRADAALYQAKKVRNKLVIFEQSFDGFKKYDL